MSGTTSVVKRTILLVEDEAIIALNEKRQLEAAGYAVIHARSGEEAIEAVQAEPAGISLILMDIDLGSGMYGTDAAKAILARHDIPLLFLSSHMEPELVRRTEEITNYGYVVKSSVFTVLDASIKMAFKLFAAKRQLDLDALAIEEANAQLREGLEKLQATNERLAESEDKFSKAFRLNPDSININRLSDGLYIDSNEGFTRIMGYAREDVIGRSSMPGDLGIWVRAEDRARLVAGLREKGEVNNLEAEFRRKDGTTTIGLMSARVIEIRGEACVISITRDMGEWIRVADERRAMCTGEKEMLLKEMRHRVKNDLAAVESYLSLRTDATADGEAASILRGAVAQVRGMKILFDRLYGSNRPERFSAGDYLPALVHEILAIFGEGRGIETSVEVEDVPVGSKLLSDLGIIVNELVTNSIKHAFAQVARPRISLSLARSGGRLRVVYTDNGPGLPPSVAEPGNDGFGLGMVRALVAQHRGNISIGESAGALFTLDFDAAAKE